MFDQALRRRVGPSADRMALSIHRRGITAATLTGLGLVTGLAAAIAAGFGWWLAALVLWLGSRTVDGLDGAVARLEGPTARGGFADLMADFTVYAAFVVGVAVGEPSARLAAVFLLAAYYLSGASFLAWSSLADEDGGDGGEVVDGVDTGDGDLALDDNRTVRFVGGLAEGFETIVACSLVCLFPRQAAIIFSVFAALVAATALQRIRFGILSLSATPEPSNPG